jgi:hypothetical protein
MEKYQWSKLNKLQLGAYAEYFIKMEMTMHGFQVYAPEVDDHGIDFICRCGTNRFIEVQVKSTRIFCNIFLPKEKFKLSPHLYLALVFMEDGKEPRSYLIRSMAWAQPNALFSFNDYGEGKVSKPEWRLNLSQKNLHLLETYGFENMIDEIVS